MILEPYLQRQRQRVDRFLQRAVPPEREPLRQAMRYSLFPGGKRIRPILALAAAEAVDGSTTVVLPFACALELIHTYSLIHDDLPAMDDDAVRRGQPTSHRIHGEALAILAGDALLTEAFRVMAEATAKLGASQQAVQVTVEVARAAGARGMVAGQAADLGAEQTVPELPTVEWIHIRKTGALIRAAVRSGAILSSARADQLKRLTRYAEYFGLAFQVVDDILDAEGSTERIGKAARRDRFRRKATFPAVMGVTAAKERARELLGQALRELQPFTQRADPLREIARVTVDRVCTS
jgi:geranylgeranyl diphosphate synthase type II